MADAERQLAVEGAQRRRVAVCSIAAGLLLFGGDLWASEIESKDPTVGLLQGLSPALHGLAAASTDPRTVHLQFLVHYQTTMIIALLVSALGAIAFIVPLRYLANAESVRSPQPSIVARYLALYAPLLIAIFIPAYEISLIIGAHNYLSGTARTAAAVTAATGGGVRFAFALIAELGQLFVAAAFVLVSLRAMRVGLLTRMLGIVGIIGGVLYVIPLTPLPVVQALWLVFVGAMLLEFGARPLPEAWGVLEARPWPSQPPRQRRPPRGGARARVTAAAPAVPEPVVQRGTSSAATKKRKRRR